MTIKTETKVGIIAVVTIAILIWGLNFLKGKDIFGRQTTYYAVYKDIGGLLPTSYVFINGMKVGQVTKISYSDPQMKQFVVRFELPSKLSLPVNSVAEVFNSDLLGSKAMRVIVGDATTYLNPGDTMFSKVEGSLLSEVGKILEPYTDKLEKIINNADTVVNNLKNITDNETQRNFHSALANINNISDHLATVSRDLDYIVGSEKGRIKDIINNIDSLSATLNNNSGKLENIISNISDISDEVTKAKLGETLSNLNKTVDELSTTMSKISNGKGNVGKLVNDDNLYDNLQKTIEDLDKLIKDIKDNPKKYINVSVF
ncbi:MAG: MCE family protein [Bacteroidales bacterium]|nr:MCE family protein [Bacteroidales bacterium]